MLTDFQQRKLDELMHGMDTMDRGDPDFVRKYADAADELVFTMICFEVPRNIIVALSPHTHDALRRFEAGLTPRPKTQISSTLPAQVAAEPPPGALKSFMFLLLWTGIAIFVIRFFVDAGYWAVH